MESPIDVVIVERRELRGLERVFRDRSHAGLVLAEMLSEFSGSNGVVLAVPAGGVPVAVEVARELGLALDVVVVSKITLPWNTEAGYGAVAADGTVAVNRTLAARVGLGEHDIEAGVAATREKVERRSTRFRGDESWPPMTARPVIVIDDGLASGYTMMVALRALQSFEPGQLIVAVPTAPADTVDRVAERVDAVYCANIRSRRPYAVADAYELWRDVPEATAVELFRRHRFGSP
jgi:predicted phosphoribosyltransferase